MGEWMLSHGESLRLGLPAGLDAARALDFSALLASPFQRWSGP